MTERGRPKITLRLEPDVMELLRQRAEPVHGRAGGVALYLRRLIYEHLGLALPQQYGDKKAELAKKPRRPPGRPRKTDSGQTA